MRASLKQAFLDLTRDIGAEALRFLVKQAVMDWSDWRRGSDSLSTSQLSR